MIFFFQDMLQNMLAAEKKICALEVGVSLPVQCCCSYLFAFWYSIPLLFLGKNIVCLQTIATATYVQCLHCDTLCCIRMQCVMYICKTRLCVHKSC